MTLILTNDDGIDAPGLAALGEAVKGLDGRVTVVAPIGAYSGCGHTVTTHKPIAVRSDAPDRFAVDGTPADCVRLAVHHIVPGASWVLSGINAGGNLGGDVFHSGTVAAAREAASHGARSVALSHYIVRGRAVDWALAARRASGVIARLLAEPWEPGTFWNVNLPHTADDRDPEVVFCPLDPSPMPLAYTIDGANGSALYAGDYHGRARRNGGDVDVCFSGKIAVSKLRLGLGW